MNSDTFYCIFGFLNARDLLSCNLVNKEFNKVSKSELLWYEICEYECPNLIKANYYKNYMDYISLSKTLKSLESMHAFLKRESLYLVGKLNWIPDCLSILQNLKILDLCNNNLSSIPESFGKLTNMKDLYLKDNRLSSFPEPILKLINLKKIDLRNNLLSSLPESINNLKELRGISLNNNPLESIPIDIKLMPKLCYVRLDYSQTKKVSDSLLAAVLLL